MKKQFAVRILAILITAVSFVSLPATAFAAGPDASPSSAAEKYISTSAFSGTSRAATGTSFSAVSGNWKKTKSGWTFTISGGSKVKSRLVKINGKLYSFNSKGVLRTGWVKSGNSWYYFNANGIAGSNASAGGGTQNPSGGIYGAAQTGWLKRSGNWYFLDTSDWHMHTGWIKVNGIWYYLTGSGAMKTGWLKYKSKWYYLGGSGAMAAGWKKIGGKWYYFDVSGAMKTGWLTYRNQKYYLQSNGAMATGWKTISQKTYYFDANGAMAANTTVGGYSVGSDGARGALVDLSSLIASTNTAKKTSQIILVVDHKLTLWNKNNGTWVKAMDTYCGYGKNGLKLAAKRKAGDKTTPIGSFPISFAFGTASNPGTSMDYRKVKSTSYWSAEKKTYNTWVESSKKVGGEHLIDYYQYKYAMAIGFNIDPVVYGRGSAIFLHCKSKGHWYTAGCVSVTEGNMVSLLKACRNGTYMIIVPDTEDIANY